MPQTELSQSAEENLRTIRTLMERATIYRAVSAGPALLGGLLSIGLAAFFLNRPEQVTGPVFILAWLGVLAVVGIFNFGLLIRESRNRGMPFPSSSTRHGLMALAPPMVACGIMGLAVGWFRGELPWGASMWVVGYGLGLLATASFAPRSIRALGWAFLVAGLGWFLWRELVDAGSANLVVDASRIMGVTFGGFHFVYAIRTGWWKRQGDC